MTEETAQDRAIKILKDLQKDSRLGKSPFKPTFVGMAKALFPNHQVPFVALTNIKNGSSVDAVQLAMADYLGIDANLKGDWRAVRESHCYLQTPSGKNFALSADGQIWEMRHGGFHKMVKSDASDAKLFYNFLKNLK